MENRKELVRNALARYVYVVDLLNKHKDKLGLELLQELIDSCRRYVQFVAEQEIESAKTIRRYGFGLFVVDEAERLSRVRIVFHNALIDRLNSFNRYLFEKYPQKIPAEGIYSLDPRGIDERQNVAEWAEYIVKGLLAKK